MNAILNLAWNAALIAAPQEPAVSSPAQTAPATSSADPVAPQESDKDKDADDRKWTDPQDGWFDLSRFIEHPKGFLPVVVPITEPALGYGAFAGAAFLDPRESAGAEGWARPNISMVGGMWTEDGSDGWFAANSTLWKDGDLQTLIGGGHMGLELDMYGIGDDAALADHPLEYTLEADALVGEARQRFGDSDFWGGLRFAYARVTVDFDGTSAGIPGIDPQVEAITLAGPALTLRYDSLDNMFTPTRGTLNDTSVSFFDDLFGGSRDFQLFQEVLIHHRPLSESVFLGGRGQFNSSFGDTPFYARPYVHLRGVPALRYQGEQAASIELELRWQFHPRVSVVGFGGVGAAWNDLDRLDDEQSAYAGGTGLRYLVSRKFGLHAGIDVARGPEEGAIYVQFGNAWLRP